MIAALRSKDMPKVTLLRQLIAEIVTFEKSDSATESSNSAANEVKVIRKCVEKWIKAIKEYDTLLVNSTRKDDLQKAIDKELGELEIIKSYLPQSYNEEELRQAINQTVTKLGITTPAPNKLGLVMKELLESLDSTKLASSKELANLVKISLS
jgi:uncharacterized protein YqeY